MVLGIVGTRADVPLFEAALQHDEPLVREHAAWALARLSTLGTDSGTDSGTDRLAGAAVAGDRA